MEEGQFGCGAKKRCIESFDDGIQLTNSAPRSTEARQEPACQPSP
jgi:hypothetical protein